MDITKFIMVNFKFFNLIINYLKTCFKTMEVIIINFNFLVIKDFYIVISVLYNKGLTFTFFEVNFEYLLDEAHFLVFLFTSPYFFITTLDEFIL